MSPVEAVRVVLTDPPDAESIQRAQLVAKIREGMRQAEDRMYRELEQALFAPDPFYVCIDRLSPPTWGQRLVRSWQRHAANWRSAGRAVWAAARGRDPHETCGGEED